MTREIFVTYTYLIDLSRSMIEHANILLFAQNTTEKNQDTYIKILDIKYNILDVKNFWKHLSGKT